MIKPLLILLASCSVMMAQEEGDYLQNLAYWSLGSGHCVSTGAVYNYSPAGSVNTISGRLGTNASTGVRACMYIDNSSNLGKTSPSLPTAKAERTMMMWTRQTTSQTTASLFGYGQNATGKRFNFYEDGNLFYVECAGVGIGSTNALNDFRWHHLCAVLPNKPSPVATDILLYVDGRRMATFAVPDGSIATATAQITIGSLPNAGGYPWKGFASDLRIYSVGLPEGIIRSIYEATRGDYK